MSNDPYASPRWGTTDYPFESERDRDAAIWRWCMEGVTTKESARRAGVSERRIQQIRNKKRGEVAMFGRSELRRDMAEQLNTMRERLAEIMAMPGAPVVKTLSGGDGAGSDLVVVRDPENGDAVVRDHSGTIGAANALTKALDRLAKLTGVDAPVQVEQSGVVRYEIAGMDPEAMK